MCIGETGNEPVTWSDLECKATSYLSPALVLAMPSKCAL